MRLAASSAARRPSAEMGTLVSIRTASAPMWKPDILGPEHLVQDAGEDVLAGVLLHLVKPPVPVDGFLLPSVPGTAVSGREANACAR